MSEEQTYDEGAGASVDGTQTARYYYGEGFWLDLFQGQIPKEYFYLLIASLTVVFGTLLPWRPLPENSLPTVPGEIVRGVDVMSGAVMCFFALIAAGVMVYNIRARRLLFWPILLMLVDNLFIMSLHFIRTGKGFVEPFQGELVFKDALWAAYRSQGIGVYFVTFGTLFVLLQILMSVFRAAGKGKEQKAAAAPAGGGGGGRRRR